jgi:hypothetical protein
MSREETPPLSEASKIKWLFAFWERLYLVNVKMRKKEVGLERGGAAAKKSE